MFKLTGNVLCGTYLYHEAHFTIIVIYSNVPNTFHLFLVSDHNYTYFPLFLVFRRTVRKVPHTQYSWYSIGSHISLANNHDYPREKVVVHTKWVWDYDTMALIIGICIHISNTLNLLLFWIISKPHYYRDLLQWQWFNKMLIRVNTYLCGSP